MKDFLEPIRNSLKKRPVDQHGSNIESDSAEAVIFPATYSQKALHFIQAFQPDAVAYSIPFEYWFYQAIDPEVLQAALNVLVSRHDILRTVYHAVALDDEEAQLQQLVLPDMYIHLVVEDLTDQLANESQTHIEAIIHEKMLNLSKQAFDLERGPLVHTRLFKITDNTFAWFLDFHHISFDHLAIWQFAKELDQAYSRLLIAPESVSVATAPLQMGDYACWQAEYQNSSVLKSKIDYWQHNIPDPAIFLDFPTDYPRPAISEAKGHELWFEFSHQLSSLLATTAQQFQVSRYLISMTLWACLLHRYTSAEKIVIGAPFANRGDQQELQNVLGCFMNTLPMVYDFHDNPSLSVLLKRAHENFLALLKRQDVAFELIIETLKPPRNTSHHPLYQVAFMYQDPPMEISLGGVAAVNKRLHNESSKFDMLLWLWDEDQQTKGSLEYSSELYTQESMETMLSVYKHMTQLMCESPETPLGEIALVAPGQSHLAALIGPQIEHKLVTEAGANTLPAVFKAALTARGEAGLAKHAVHSDQGNLTYGDLDQQSNALAAFLIQQGVGRGDLIGVCLHRGLALFSVLLGILKSGAAYVPLDPEYPVDRIQYMVDHSKMKTLITQTSLTRQTQHLMKDSLACIMIDEWLQTYEVLNEQATQALDFNFDPETPAYVIYTSGSTGVPKGVVVPHRSLTNLVLSLVERPGFKNTDRLMAITTLSFDVSVPELYLPLLTGGLVDIVPTQVAKDAAALLTRMAVFKPTFMVATPATWRMLLLTGLDDSPWLGQLRTLIAGEALPQDLVIELLPKVGQIWNMYGPTETCVYSTGCQITDAQAPIEIGTSLANTQCYILDEQQRLLPPGVPGELYIGGDGVTLGYLHQPKLTHDRFIHKPDLVDGLLYRTGDRVTRLPRGVLRFHNRLDFQVKIRGFRIELGEIEHRLLQQPDVATGAVVIQNQKILAFYGVKEGKELSVLNIRKFMAQALPKYMIPDHFVALDVFPMTPAGKMDRKQLAAFQLQNSQVSSQNKPQTDSEIYYAKVWAKILNRNIDTIGLNDNFFDLGGHSLVSLQVVSQLKKDYSMAMPANALVLNTLGQLAQAYPIPEAVTQTTTQSLMSTDSQEQAAQQVNAHGRWANLWQSVKDNFKS